MVMPDFNPGDIQPGRFYFIGSNIYRGREHVGIWQDYRGQWIVMLDQVHALNGVIKFECFKDSGQIQNSQGIREWLGRNVRSELSKDKALGAEEPPIASVG